MILDVWDPFATAPPQGTGGETPEGAPAYPMLRYLIHNAWISHYQAIPSLDSRANEVALLSVEVTHEGWQAVGVSPNATVPDGLAETDPETAIA
jgi:hypothetical protein